MAPRRSKWIVTAALSLATLAPLAACSSAPTEPHGDPSASGAAAASVPGAPVAEADRVHAYLESRYPAAAVRHAYRTALGQTVDCVDFFQMPGVRAMAARGEPITEIPKPPAPQPRRLRDGRTIVDPPQAAPASEGLDEDGHERLCPEGTVPQIRISPDEIARAGGLDAYRTARQKHPPARMPEATRAAPPGAPPTMWPCESGEYHQYAHVIGDVVDRTPGIALAMDEMSVYAPSIPQQNANHTVGQVWLFGGTIAQDLATDPGCDPATMDCVQTIEIGWIESAGDSSAHLFTFSTNNGYTAPNSGCWNGDGSAGCPPFVWSTGFPSSVAPGASIPVNGPFSTTPEELSALVIQINGNYWVQVSVGGGQRYYIGYYPGSNFRGPLSTFQVGGEVYDGANDFTNPGIAMGSGFPAGWGFGWAAYHHDFNAMVYANGQQTNYWDATMCASVPPNYSYAPYGYDRSAAPGSPSWSADGGYFYYGGTPAACTPSTCGSRCGSVPDGCGNLLWCGACPCVPTTCAGAGADCGSIPDGCGHTLQCGTCGTGTTCISNVCECTPKKCAAGFYWNDSDCMCERICNPRVCY